ncbi:MAG: FeoA family protein [Oleibacter sp.]|nr:FeoA family protein [Thalassolituus sp.]
MMTELTLDQITIGQRARIVGFSDVETNFRRKLLALGMMPGAEVEVRRAAPMGDPIQIVLRGASISLRKQEASIIEVEAL